MLIDERNKTRYEERCVCLRTKYQGKLRTMNLQKSKCWEADNRTKCLALANKMYKEALDARASSRDATRGRPRERNTAHLWLSTWTNQLSSWRTILTINTLYDLQYHGLVGPAFCFFHCPTDLPPHWAYSASSVPFNVFLNTDCFQAVIL